MGARGAGGTATVVTNPVPEDLGPPQQLLPQLPSFQGHTHRRLAVNVHAHLRQLIVQGTLSPGTELNQAQLARSLQVSRTPMREAFRMLQEEGLIHAEPDRRAVVVGLNVADLDSLYASRILLEGLAVSLTVPLVSPAMTRSLGQALTSMNERRSHRRTSPAWARSHRRFHEIATSGADPQLLKLLASLSEGTQRYLRLAQASAHDTWAEGEAGHRAVLDAFRDKDPRAAVTAMVNHLATTAMRVVADVDPDRDLPAVAHSLSMLANSSDPEALRLAVASRGTSGDRS